MRRRKNDTARNELKRIEREACDIWMAAMASRAAAQLNTETEHELAAKQAHFNAYSALLDYDVRLIRATGVY